MPQGILHLSEFELHDPQLVLHLASERVYFAHPLECTSKWLLELRNLTAHAPRALQIYDVIGGKLIGQCRRRRVNHDQIRITDFRMLKMNNGVEGGRPE